MADTPHIKRPRDEEEEEVGAENPKRPKPYTNIILSLLDNDDEEEVESSGDISAIFTSLEREITSSEEAGRQSAEENSSVMRRLLEASDDELGIPDTGELLKCGEDDCAYKELLVWEIEDASANYNDNVAVEFRG